MDATHHETCFMCGKKLDEYEKIYINAQELSDKSKYCQRCARKLSINCMRCRVKQGLIKGITVKELDRGQQVLF